MNDLYLHRFDERDLDCAQLPRVCYRFAIYKCCEDEHGVVYLLTEQPEFYYAEMEEAA